MSRETMLTKTFVELADTLVADFDIIDLLALLADRSVEVLGATAAGILLASPQGELKVIASSSETARLLEVFEIQAREGPCLDCFHTGDRILSTDLGTDPRWPGFAAEATAVGFRSAAAQPLRLRGSVLGALNLFNDEPAALSPADLDAAQALADVATIAILQHRAAIEAHTVNEQLSYALNSRVTIEQAKGVLAEREGVSMDQAFTTIRHHARNHNLRLADLAASIVAGAPTAELDRPTRSR
jgi:GAF domain-containing protein